MRHKSCHAFKRLYYSAEIHIFSIHLVINRQHLELCSAVNLVGNFLINLLGKREYIFLGQHIALLYCGNSRASFLVMTLGRDLP